MHEHFFHRDFFGSMSPYPDLIEALENPQPSRDLAIGRGIKAKDKPIIRPLLLTLSEVSLSKE